MAPVVVVVGGRRAVKWRAMTGRRGGEARSKPRKQLSNRNRKASEAIEQQRRTIRVIPRTMETTNTTRSLGRRYESSAPPVHSTWIIRNMAPPKEPEYGCSLSAAATPVHASVSASVKATVSATRNT